jgi:hypothetical protein
MAIRLKTNEGQKKYPLIHSSIHGIKNGAKLGKYGAPSKVLAGYSGTGGDSFRQSALVYDFPITEIPLKRKNPLGERVWIGSLSCG